MRLHNYMFKSNALILNANGYKNKIQIRAYLNVDWPDGVGCLVNGSPLKKVGNCAKAAGFSAFP